MQRTLAVTVSLLLGSLLLGCSGEDNPPDPELWGRPGEEWARLLTDPDELISTAALEELCSFDDEELNAQVLWLLHHESESVRLRVCEMAALHAGDGGSVGLLHAIEDPSWEVRAAAARLIGLAWPRGDNVYSALEAALGDDMEQVRLAAAGRLVRAAKGPGLEYLKMLTEALVHEDAGIRKEAANSLGIPSWSRDELRSARAGARSALREAMGDTDAEVRLHAAKSLHAILGAEAFDRHRGGGGREEDDAALQKDQQSVVRALVEVMNTAGREVRREAAYVLTRVMVDLSILRDRLSDEDPVVRQALVVGLVERLARRRFGDLKSMGPEDDPLSEACGILRGVAAGDESPVVRASALAGLAMIGPRSLWWDVKDLPPLLDAESPRVRVLIAHAFEKLGESRSRAEGVGWPSPDELADAERVIMDCLLRLLGDDHASVRMQACLALSWFGGYAQEFRSRLEKLRAGDEAHRVRVAAEQALCRIDGM